MIISSIHTHKVLPPPRTLGRAGVRDMDTVKLDVRMVLKVHFNST